MKPTDEAIEEILDDFLKVCRNEDYDAWQALQATEDIFAKTEAAIRQLLEQQDRERRVDFAKDITSIIETSREVGRQAHGLAECKSCGLAEAIEQYLKSQGD